MRCHVVLAVVALRRHDFNCCCEQQGRCGVEPLNCCCVQQRFCGDVCLKLLLRAAVALRCVRRFGRAGWLSGDATLRKSVLNQCATPYLSLRDVSNTQCLKKCGCGFAVSEGGIRLLGIASTNVRNVCCRKAAWRPRCNWNGVVWFGGTVLAVAVCSDC